MIGYPKQHRQKKPSSDPAAFDADALRAIYGERPRCFLTNIWQWVDPHHIMGRGHRFGFHFGRPERTWFSSVYNYAPVARDIHHGPRIDSRNMRLMLLGIAREHVNDAIHLGRYTLTDCDRAFLRFIDNYWREEGGKVGCEFIDRLDAGSESVAVGDVSQELPLLRSHHATGPFHFHGKEPTIRQDAEDVRDTLLP